MTITPPQQTNQKKQYMVIVKVIIAMTIFLLGVPFLMYLSSSYFTNKGLMLDAYLMTQEYTAKVTTFYKNNNRCPTTEDMSIKITQEDAIGRLILEAEPQTNTCYLVASLKNFNASTSGKLLVLYKSFTAENTTWQCSSNANTWYLPRNCNTTLPKQYQVN